MCSQGQSRTPLRASCAGLSATSPQPTPTWRRPPADCHSSETRIQWQTGARSFWVTLSDSQSTHVSFFTYSFWVKGGGRHLQHPEERGEEAAGKATVLPCLGHPSRPLCCTMPDHQGILEKGSHLLAPRREGKKKTSQTPWIQTRGVFLTQ